MEKKKTLESSGKEMRKDIKVWVRIQKQGQVLG